MIKRAWKIGYVEVVGKIEKLNSQIWELRLGGGSFEEQSVEIIVLWKVLFLTLSLIDTIGAVDSKNFHSGKVDVSNWIN